MVGEIRDRDTAEISIKAALTGHLVLSTLHTNDAPNSVTRLLDMGVEPFLVSSSLHLVVAQRLVRKICVRCKRETDPPREALQELELHSWNGPLYAGTGCPECSHSGYRGRVAVYEVLPFGEQLKELVFERSSAAVIKKKARSLGMMTLRESGIAKVRAGLTTLEEVFRVTERD
jgi:type II secretory ATPase GspE/PulE/Tfp pilus assembly ATPase PilB-like protein